jgi:hypothetical protein
MKLLALCKTITKVLFLFLFFHILLGVFTFGGYWFGLLACVEGIHDGELLGLFFLGGAVTVSLMFAVITTYYDKHPQKSPYPKECNIYY